jgi:hypothetical protein
MIIKAKKDLRNLPWPPPFKDNDHHSPALRWSLLLHIMELRKQGLEVGEPIYSNFDLICRNRNGIDLLGKNTKNGKLKSN